MTSIWSQISPYESWKFFSRSVFDVWKFAKEKRIIEILNVREFFLLVRNLWSKAWLQMIIIKDSVEKKRISWLSEMDNGSMVFFGSSLECTLEKALWSRARTRLIKVPFPYLINIPVGRKDSDKQWMDHQNLRFFSCAWRIWCVGDRNYSNCSNNTINSSKRQKFSKSGSSTQLWWSWRKSLI